MSLFGFKPSKDSDMVLTVLSLAANLGCHAVFVWGRYKVFRIDNRTPAGVRLIEASAAGSILVGLGLIVSRDGPRLELDASAIVLAVISTALFAWGVAVVHRGHLTAAFSDDVPAELITAGPFRYIRHPFYVSYLLSYLQAVIVSRSGWAILPLLWMAGIYVRAALLEERKFLKSPLANEYCRYAACTGRFVPAVTHLTGYRHAN